MRRLFCPWLVLAVSLGNAVLAGAAEPVTIFNGRDLDGWIAEGPSEITKDGKKTPIWTVADGLLRCAGGGFGFLRYDKQEYTDFKLHVEYRFPGKGNSGLGIRTTKFDPKKSVDTRPSYYSYEIQLLDDAGKEPNEHGTASLYRYVAPKKNRVKPSPEWNMIEVECVGPVIKINVNGEEVLNVDQSTVNAIKNKPLKGYVCLQNHGSKIEFRNVTVQDLAK